MNIAIVGGGIAGLSFALGLHQRGIDCDVFESVTDIKEIGVGITLLPHYTLPCYVAPGFSNTTPMKLWTVNQLLDEGAVKSTAFLWPRHTLASGGWHG